MTKEEFEKAFAESAEKFGIAKVARREHLDGLQDMMIQLSHLVASNDSPKWISVDDRLPSYDNHHVNMLVYSAASFIAYYDGCKWWACGQEQMEIKPSHWMPLPEHPKIKK